VSHIIRRNILARVEQASPVVEEEQASLMMVKEEKTSLVVVEEEQASSVWEEEQSLPPIGHQVGPSLSFEQIIGPQHVGSYLLEAHQ
jgi:hypothetical protein